MQALQPTPLAVTPISLSEAQILLEQAKKAHQQQCTPATPDADTLFFAQREVELAQLRLLAVLTPTAAPLPPPTIALSRITTTINVEHTTQIYSPVAGQVQEIKIIKADNRYATIRITIALPNGSQTSCRHLPKGAPSGLPASNHFICRDIYALSANIESKLADFVAYCITPEQLDGQSEQSREWMADPDQTCRKTPRACMPALLYFRTRRLSGRKSSTGSETEAYVFDQDTPEGTDYRSGMTTVGEIERLTGLGFR